MRPFFAALKRALMVIEIEHKEIAGIVREQRIDADDIAAVLPLAFQMGEQSADVQRLIGPVRAVPAGNFLPCRFRAEFVIPKCVQTGNNPLCRPLGGCGRCIHLCGL